MEDYKSYLLSHRIGPDKKVDYYLSWVTQFYAFCNKRPSDRVSEEQIDRFLRHLTKTREEWQVNQANEAIQLYLYFNRRNHEMPGRKDLDSRSQWRAVGQDMVKILRLKHRSFKTEKTYMYWLRLFYRFLDGKSPYSLDASYVKDFMTYLAVERKVAASTQNQAFNAILFLFRYILNKDIEDIAGAIRARKRRRLPVVLSKQEVFRLFDNLNGLNLLMAQLIYGCGLRLQECVELRIKDIDFERNCVTVRSAKGDKDRQTLLPESLKDRLRKQLDHVRGLFEADRRDNVDGVQLPGALERKYPNAGKEWAWQWVFPFKLG